MIQRRLPDPRVFDRVFGWGMAKWLTGLACAATLLMAGCSRPAESLPVVEIEHTISPEPVRVGPATVTLKLADGAGKAITGAHIAIEAVRMPNRLPSTSGSSTQRVITAREK